MDYLYICKKGTTMWNEMSNPAVLMRIGVNNNQKRYHIIIKKWTTATCKNIKMLERGQGYFPFSRFLFR